MDSKELMKIIQDGEGNSIEFKESMKEITKDVYDTVCSFSNRDGGHILLGVRDNGEITGVDETAVIKMKKDFVTAVNNPNKVYPPLYLQIETYEIEGKKILYIHVPVSSQVCRHHGRIYDRNNDSDIDITDNTDLVYQVYARKRGSYFVNKVTRF